MEIFAEICSYLWTVMVIGAFFVCLKRGWLKKGFYLSSDEVQEEEKD